MARISGEHDGTIFVRGKWVSFDKKVINAYYKLEEEIFKVFQALAQHPNYDTILQRLTKGKVSWKRNPSGQILFSLAKGWNHFIAAKIIPSDNIS